MNKQYIVGRRKRGGGAPGGSTRFTLPGRAAVRCSRLVYTKTEYALLLLSSSPPSAGEAT